MRNWKKYKCKSQRNKVVGKSHAFHAAELGSVFQPPSVVYSSSILPRMIRQWRTKYKPGTQLVWPKNLK